MEYVINVQKNKLYFFYRGAKITLKIIKKRIFEVKK